MTHVNGKRRVAYKFRGKQNPQSWMKYWEQKKPKGEMFVAGISSRGTTALRFIPPKAKVNADYHIKHVLKPLFEKDLPKLFGKDSKSVVLHHDSAPAHTAAATYKWLRDNGYKFISKENWPANSPDLSPMDYGVNGFFKRQLWRRRALTLGGLKKVMRQEWRKISVSLCLKVLQSWEKRVNLMLENNGYQIEHLL